LSYFGEKGILAYKAEFVKDFHRFLADKIGPESDKKRLYMEKRYSIIIRWKF